MRPNNSIFGSYNQFTVNRTAVDRPNKLKTICVVDLEIRLLKADIKRLKKLYALCIR